MQEGGEVKDETAPDADTEAGETSEQKMLDVNKQAMEARMMARDIILETKLPVDVEYTSNEASSEALASNLQLAFDRIGEKQALTIADKLAQKPGALDPTFDANEMKLKDMVEKGATGTQFFNTSWGYSFKRDMDGGLSEQYKNLRTHQDKAAFRAAYMSAKWNKIRSTKQMVETSTTKWRERGVYMTFIAIAGKEGYHVHAREALSVAYGYASKCLELGPPWVNFNSWKDRLEFLYVTSEYMQEFTRMYSILSEWSDGGDPTAVAMALPSTKPMIADTTASAAAGSGAGSTATVALPPKKKLKTGEEQEHADRKPEGPHQGEQEKPEKPEKPDKPKGKARAKKPAEEQKKMRVDLAMKVSQYKGMQSSEAFSWLKGSQLMEALSAEYNTFQEFLDTPLGSSGMAAALGSEKEIADWMSQASVASCGFIAKLDETLARAKSSGGGAQKKPRK